MGRKDSQRGFGSFGDLRKALNGGEDDPMEAAPAESAPDKGWTLETDDGQPYEFDDDELEGLPDPDAAIPARRRFTQS